MRYALHAAIQYFPALLRYSTQQIVIADFCLNVRNAKYRVSTLRRYVNQAAWEGAREEIQKWVWGVQIVVKTGEKSWVVGGWVGSQVLYGHLYDRIVGIVTRALIWILTRLVNSISLYQGTTFY